jgi:hypothetical protein
MTKNMTRKGLAFGAGLALVASGLAGAPAQAVGLAGFISLLPADGPATALAVGANVDQNFIFNTLPASNISGAGNLKFLVTDASGEVLPATDGLTDDGVAAAYPEVVLATGDTITFEADGDLVIGGLANTNTLIKTGDIVEFEEALVSTNSATIIAADTRLKVKLANATSLTFAAADVVRPTLVLTIGDAVDITNDAGGATPFDVDFSSLANALVFDAGDTFKVSADVVVDSGAITVLTEAGGPYTVTTDTVATTGSGAFTVDDSTSASVVASKTVKTAVTLSMVTSVINTSLNTKDIYKVSRTSPDVTNGFVVDSGITSSAVTFELKHTTTTARTVTVVAWVDAFDNDKIDATEYVSAEQVLSFVDMSKIAYATTLDAPTVGAETLTARITTSPMLNGAYTSAADDIRALFTRANSTTSLVGADATQSYTTGVWTSVIDLELVAANGIGSDAGSTVVADGTLTGAGWAGGLLTPDKTVAGDGVTATGSVTDNHIESLAINATTKTVSVTTEAAHQLMDGDLITMTATTSGLESAADASRPVTVTGDSSFTYVLDTTGTVTAGTVAADAAATLSYTVVTYTTGDTTNQFFKASRVFPGDYSATAYYEAASTKFLKGGLASSKGTLSVTAADVILTTTGTASVQGIRENDSTNDGLVDLFLKTGTASATVVATVVDEDGDAVGAGRSVSITPSGATAGKGILVAGVANTLTKTLTTDANGQVEISIASTAGTDSETVIITVVAEGQSSTTSVLEVVWADAVLTMSDLNMTNSVLDAAPGHSGGTDEQRYILEGTSYSMNLMVSDQWFTGAASADYRIKVTGGAATAGFAALVDGKATVTITDNGTAPTAGYDTVLTLQKKNTAGVFADVAASARTVSTLMSKNPGILLGADGSNLYGMDGSEFADLSDAVAKKAVVERDTRTSFVAQPVYTNSVVVTGKIVDDGTKTALGGAVVTMSGPSNVLFVNGSVEKRGSITFLASEADGEFDVSLFSTTAQTDSVITVTSMGVSKTTKVSFTGAGIGEGTSLVVTMPAAVKPASTFQVKAKLSDVYGNGVNTLAESIKVTYTGAGIVFGTLPNETDANGELTFSVLLGSNDTGSVNVTVQYNQNGDEDFTDAKDLTTVGTTAITASGVVAASSDTIVNVGTFSGKLVVYALNAAGSEVSYKIAGKWVTQVVTSDLLQRYDRVVGATGKTIKVDIYVDGVLKLAKSVVTK